MEIIVSLLKNKYFWIALAIIIVLVILHRNWNIIKEKVLDQKNPSYATDDQGNVIKVSQLDANRLDKLVVDTRTAITKLGGASSDDFKKLTDLTDQELEYVAKQYKSSYQEVLYKNVDDEIMPFSSADEDLMARLDKLGYKS